MLIRVWDNGGRNIKLDQAQFINTGPLGGNSKFNMEAQFKKASKVCLVGWLKHLSKEKEVGMSSIPWVNDG